MAISKLPSNISNSGFNFSHTFSNFSSGIMAEEKAAKEVVDGEKKRGFGSWLWLWNGDDFEKRLQYIYKQEATLVARINRRSSTWRSTARNLILVSVLLEVVALVYAIITTRTMGLDWQMRALRVLPIFLFPAFSSAFYWALFSFTRMRDSRDQKTVDRLQAERQEKIDELKERSNYYATQQLIQKYDSDPAAKAAAATILASKLGADSGLKVFLRDELQHTSEATGMSNDIEPVNSSGLRKRNISEATSKGGNDMEMYQHAENEISPHNPVVVEHHDANAFGARDGGWIARLAQLLVGEDPSQSYALICGNCHMHNGLARKEDFPFITYYCPRCHALNRAMNSSSGSPSTSTLDATIEGASPNSGSMKTSAISSPVMHETEKVSATSSPVTDPAPMSENVTDTSSHVGEMETIEKMVTDDPSTQ
ncbi:putative Lunapark domain-containing protein [Helianthus annuus]|nr:putative Lunapark domain-containing protein [Helianthus annuus]